MDAIMKRVIRRKEDFFGVVPALTRNHRAYPLEKVAEPENPDGDTEAD